MHRLWLTVFGTGYSPVMPGTCASLAVALVFLLSARWAKSPWLVGLIMLLIALHGFWVTVRYGDRFIARYGEDPGRIVSDEQCGQALTFSCFLWMGSHVAGAGQVAAFAAVGFVLFRAFDIIKPPPARHFDRMKGPWGVALDDVMAGLYANLLLQLIWLGHLPKYIKQWL
ncbi:MAG: phosphatidylglycerophosphatase A [Sedimentisphaerales bacterium]|nr:phosphatidylglycerophosphatase A [Sedimentisphaerales bacterium]